MNRSFSPSAASAQVANAPAPRRPHPLLQRLGALTAVGALAVSVGCADDLFDDAYLGNDLGVKTGTLDGAFGPFEATDSEATQLSSFESDYSKTVTVYVNATNTEDGTAFAYTEWMGALLDEPRPGVVYYSNQSDSEAAPVIFDETGDTYVRIDDGEELVETDEAYVMLCGEGTNGEGQVDSYDAPADELLVEVRDVESDDAGRDAVGDDGRQAINQPLTDQLATVRPELSDLEVSFTAIAYDRDEDTWEPTGEYHVTTGRFIIPRTHARLGE